MGYSLWQAELISDNTPEHADNTPVQVNTGEETNMRRSDNATPVLAGSVLYHYHNGKGIVSEPRYLLCWDRGSYPGPRIEWFASQSSYFQYIQNQQEVEAKGERRVLYLKTVINIVYEEHKQCGCIVLLTHHGTERRFALPDKELAKQWTDEIKVVWKTGRGKRMRPKLPLPIEEEEYIAPLYPALDYGEEIYSEVQGDPSMDPCLDEIYTELDDVRAEWAAAYGGDLLEDQGTGGRTPGASGGQVSSRGAPGGQASNRGASGGQVSSRGASGGQVSSRGAPGAQVSSTPASCDEAPRMRVIKRVSTPPSRPASTASTASYVKHLPRAHVAQPPDPEENYVDMAGCGARGDELYLPMK